MSNQPISAAEVPGFEKLTLREQQFVMHPDVFRDPRKAAKESGYSDVVVQKKAHSMRQKLMRFIQPAFQAVMADLGMDRRRVEQELAAVAVVDITDYQERIDVEMPDGGWQTITVWRDPMTLPPAMRRAIKFIEWGTETLADGTVLYSDRPTNVGFHSKEKALHELTTLFGDAPLKNPVAEDQSLLDNLTDEERAGLTRLYAVAAKRAARQNSPIEGEHANRKEVVRRLKAPSPPSDDRRGVDDARREAPRDVAPDNEQPAPQRRVPAGGGQASAPSAPRRARASRAPDIDPNDDHGFNDLP